MRERLNPIVAIVALLLAVLPRLSLAASKIHAPAKKPTPVSDDSDDSDSDESDVASGSVSESDEEDDDEDPWAIEANVGFVSDYFLRGLSQTNHQPAIQGGFDWEAPFGLYLGVWSSNVRFPESPTSIELDWAAGYRYHFNEYSNVSLGVLYYYYFKDMNRASWDVPLAAEWHGFKGEIDYSPRWDSTGEHAWYFNAGWQDEVLWGVSPGAFVGYSLYPSSSDFPSYIDFKISLSREFLGLTWEIAGIFTKVQKIMSEEEITITDPDDEELTVTRNWETIQGGSRAIFSVSKSF